MQSINIHNLTYYRDLPFEDYLALPGRSFSSFKGPVTETEGMRLGTRVHQFLLEPEQYDWKDAEIVRPIATRLREFLGDAIQYMEREVSFTCLMEYEGMGLWYKGRADLIKIGTLLVDLKILSSSIQQACEMFGYPAQQSGYCIATTTPRALILSYNKLRRKVESQMVAVEQGWWKKKILTHGMPIPRGELVPHVGGWPTA